MPARWARGSAMMMTLGVVPVALHSQTATRPLAFHTRVLPANPGFRHHKKLRALYDSLGDSTQLSRVTHKGRYFLTIQRPRLTWSVVYAGRTPESPPREIVLEFRRRVRPHADRRSGDGHGRRHSRTTEGRPCDCTSGSLEPSGCMAGRLMAC
jgi:hypothetical protein